MMNTGLDFRALLQKIQIMNRDNRLMTDEPKTGFSMLTITQHQQCSSGAEQMKTLLMNIETEIVIALRKTNGSVGWRVIAEMVAGGPGRVQPVNRTAIAKFVMSTDGAQYIATKLQPTRTPFHKEHSRWWANIFHVFWEEAKLLRMKTQIMTVHLDENGFIVWS